MRARRHSAGFSLVSAIFLLVVIASAVAFMVRIVGVERASVSFSWQGARGYRAALSGLEWGAYEALNNPASCPVGTTTVTQFPLSEGGLSGFRVRVECESDIHDQGGSAETRFHIRATAEWLNFGDRDYVSRRAETTISNGG